jgi:hypothetical protein
MPTTAPPGRTIGQIAQDLGVPLHRVEFAIRSRGIEPSQRIARWRLWDDAGFERVKSTLARIESDRTGR